MMPKQGPCAPTSLALAALATSYALGLGCQGKPASAPRAATERPPQATPAAALSASPQAASYALALAQVRHRYGDLAGALGELARCQAVAARGSVSANQALRLAGDIHLAQGQTQQAIASYERALGLDAAAGAARGAASVTPRAGVDERLLDKLAGLYLAAGRLADAEHALQGATRSALANDDKYRLNKLGQARIALYDKMKTLPKRLEQAALALRSQTPQAHADLRLLAAYHHPRADAARRKGSPAAAYAVLVSIYERLYALRPADDEARQRLLWAYEQAGRLEDAGRLLARSEGRAEGSGQCPNGSEAQALTGEAATTGRIVSLFLRHGQKDPARAAIATLERRGKKEGRGDLLIAAAQLFEKLEAGNQAAAALIAAQDTCGEKQRRRAAAALAHLAHSKGAPTSAMQALARLRPRWQASPDPCLRALANTPR